MRHKILTIDDHPDTLEIVSMTLKAEGFEVVSFLSPLKALKAAAAERPDMVIVDKNMPDMDGVDVVRHLRAMPEIADIPILMFSAENQPADKKAGFAAGVDDYLTKPTEPEEMIARVEEILQDREPKAASIPSLKTTVMDDTAEEEDEFSFLDEPSASQQSGEGVVAIIGARSGVGATTLAINTAVISAAQGQATTLVDMDTRQGHIALYLNQTPSKCINILAKQPAEALGSDQVRQQLIPYAKKLNLLLARPNLDGRYPPPEPKQADAIMNALMPAQRVVVDLGQGLLPYAHPVLDYADHIIVCLQSERVSLTAARQILKRLRASVLPTTTVHALIFDNGVHLHRQGVENFIGQPLAGVVPAHPQQATHAVNKGVALTRLYPQTAAAVLFQQLTRQFSQK